jgi:hypothetical protein
VALSRRQLLRSSLGAAAGVGAAAGLIWLQHQDEPTTGLAVVTTDAPGPPLPSPFTTDLLFQPGTRLRLANGDTVVAAVEPAGVLELPTGQLVAVDPSWLPSFRHLGIGPYTVSAPPGFYSLTLGLAVWSDIRVAAAKLTIRDKPVASWDMALRTGQDTATLPLNHFFGVGVDVATIALFDAVSLPEMADLVNAGSTAFDLLNGRHTTGSVEMPHSNAIAFETGWGDGAYPVWIGRTGDGSVAAYLVDMLMLAPDPEVSPSPS